MRLWTRIGALAVVLVLGATAAVAEVARLDQEEGHDPIYVRHDERDWEDEGRWALGLGLGLINLDDPRLTDQRVADDVEVYWNLNLRIAIGPDRRGRRGQGAWRGYLEPELGYWESSEPSALPAVGTVAVGTGLQQTGRSDLLLGLNIVGVMPWHAVDFFIGAGAGIHFIDQDLRVFTLASPTAPVVVSNESASDEALGVNVHFGVDVRISRRTSLYGVGRFDIVDDESNSTDIKAYLGIRFRLGGHRGRRWSPDDDGEDD